MELRIEYLAINSLTPYERNNKKHENFDVEQIAKSITKYGMLDPIGIWGENNTIVEGHGRVLACKKLGMQTVPCIRLDELTDEQRREYAIVHNKSSEVAEYDFDNLAKELEELDLSDFAFDFDLKIDDETEPKERKEVDLNESISVVVECADDEEAEMIFQQLTEEGYKCHISTL